MSDCDWKYVYGQDIEVGMALHRASPPYSVIVAIEPYVGPFTDVPWGLCIGIARFADGTGMSLWQDSGVAIAQVASGVAS